MGIIIEILLNLILEVVVQMFFEILIALGYESIASSFKGRKEVNKYLALAGCFLLGSFIGLLSYLIYPNYIIKITYLHGISLFVSPVIVGLIMKKWGETRIESNKSISILATFWGGAIFAFAYSLVRFLLLK